MPVVASVVATPAPPLPVHEAPLSQQQQIRQYQQRRLSGSTVAGEALQQHLHENPQTAQACEILKARYDLPAENFSFRYH